MAKFDEAWKAFFSDNRRFADIMNMYCYQGEQVVKPEDVKEADTGQKVKVRDTVRKIVQGQKVMICGIENQEMLDHSLAARIMGYDHGDYEKQIRDIRRRNAQAFKEGYKTDVPGEMMYRFLKTDKLSPVGTIVIYSGGKWTAPRNLWELCGLTRSEGRRLKIVNNYPLHIIELTELSDENLEQFTTDIKQVFTLLKYSGKRDKIRKELENRKKYGQLSEDAGELISKYCRVDFKKYSDDKEAILMGSVSENFQKIFKEEREEAEQKKVHSIVQRMLKKGKYTSEEIADCVGISLKEVKKIEKELLSPAV